MRARLVARIQEQSSRDRVIVYNRAMSEVYRYQPYSFLLDADSERELKQRWLVRFRLIALLVQAVCVLTAFQFGRIDARQLALGTVILSLALVFNLYALLGNWLLTRLDNAYFFAQQFFDLLAIGSLLAVTGGWHNPFVPVLFLHVTLGAVMIEGRLALLFLSALLATLAMLVQPMSVWAEVRTWLTWYLPLALMVVAHFLLVWRLVEYLRRNREQASQLKLAKLQMDRLHGLGALTAGLCHELATPLNTVRLRIDRAARTTPGADLDEALAALDQCQLVLDRLIDSKADPSQFRFARVAWAAELEDIVASWRVGYEGLEVLLALGPNLGTVALPRMPVANCICDLLDNAAEAMGGKGTLWLRAVADGARVRLTIEDQGPGWPESVLAHFGEPFISTKPQGVGLGIYNAVQLIGALGGSLTLRAGAAGGAVVALELPRGPNGEGHE